MNPSVKKFLTCILAGIAAVSTQICVLNALSMEQAQVLMPEISVYVHDEDANLSSLSLDQISASLDGNPLTVDSFALSDEGIFYVYMLDVSNSTKQEYFDAAKNTVLNTVKNMRPQDELSLISFGEEVNILLKGGESEDEIYDVLNSMTCTDTSTKFYDAMNTLLETVESHSDMRRIAVAVSDGFDETADGMSMEDLEQVLRQDGVSVYGLIFDYATEEECSSFKHLIDLSGGQYYTYNPDNIGEIQNELSSSVDQVYKLTLTADSDQADGEVHSLEVTLGDNEPITTEVKIDKTSADYAKPEVTDLAIDNTNKNITVSFSKNIANAADSACYTLTADDGSTSAVQILSSTENTVTLTGEIFTGSAVWTLNIAGLTDTTENANKITPVALALEGLEQTEETPAVPEETAVPAEEDSGISDLLLPIGGGVLVILLLILLFFVHKKNSSGSSRSKKEKKAKNKKENKKNKHTGKQNVQFYFENSDKKEE